MPKAPNELLHYLTAIGITTYTRRTPHAPHDSHSRVSGNPLPESKEKMHSNNTPNDWKTLTAEVAQCEKCTLYKTRTNTVFGVGNHNASWLFIGEGPGAEEDARGEPFVGRAGKLLDRMLSAIGFTRDQVYIANIVKCRPPDNRNPRPEEAQQCMPYLRRQIALLNPDIIICLGSVAMKEVLTTETPVGKMRGKLHHYPDTDPPTPVVVTYHPAYLLRSPDKKKSSWEDLQFACKTVGHALPPTPPNPEQSK